MAKDNGGASGPWAHALRELFSTEIYKRSQGRLVRQLTCVSIWIVCVLAAYRIYQYLHVGAVGLPPALAYVIPAVLLAVGLWLGFRIVNFAGFADFLIAVEAEMNKVSWPSRTELVRSSMVVIILMFGLTLVLFGYDVILRAFFEAIGVVQ
jgi:preprotein translocase subunit SecE